MSSTRILLTVPALLFAFAAGCRAEEPAEPAPPADAATAALTDGTPETVGTLRFLNDASTTFVVLDDDVPLPSNAAANLIAHRNGLDGVHGTADDDPFDDVAEVLAVKQIGPGRLKKIAAYADGSGFVPQGDDVLGSYDGVTFSADDAVATLALVNAASDSQLDDDIALDRRAVDSILAERPIGTVLQLSELYYVGASALTKLKAWATSGNLADVGEDCSKTSDCVSGLHCQGKPYDGSPAIGRCVPLANVPGADDDCNSDADCLDGLLCSGLTIYNTGYCRPEWMFGSYASSAVSMPIPDNDPAGASMDLVVYGLASVPEDIMVNIDLVHPRPQDLVVTLISTNGSDSLLWNNDSSPAFYLPAFGIERDNYINGKLTLEVVDTATGETGVLNGFDVWVSSRYD